MLTSLFRTTVNSRLADTSLLRTAAKSPAKVTDVLLKQTPAIMDSRYYGLTDTGFGPDVIIVIVFTLVTADTERHL